MKSNNLIKILRQGNIVIPVYLFSLREKLKLDYQEFVFLGYLLNQGENFSFNPTKISEDFSISLMEVMTLISSLTDKRLLEVVVTKNDKNIMEEFISLAAFYNKISNLIVEDISLDKENSTSSIYEQIEREFARTLSPMEYEIIKAWLDSNIKEELIIEALKEATYNGVSNLRYIDKILYEWGKKGFKTKEDVEKHQNRRKEEKEIKPKTEVFEYKWFDDDDETE